MSESRTQNSDRPAGCQVAGDRSFGHLDDERRPILQKGDNFRSPEDGKRYRYIPVILKATSAKKPTVKLVTDVKLIQ